MEGEAHSYRKLLTLIMASASIKRPRPCQNDTDDDLGSPNFVFSGNDTFARFLVIQSQMVESSDLFFSVYYRKTNRIVNRDSKISQKKKKKTLLVETNRKTQTENLLKVTPFFNLKVSVTEHNSLNSSKESSETVC